jgi:transposase-like protein
MNNRKEEQIRLDRELGGLSFRSLASKYGIPLSTLHKMLSKKQDEQATKADAAELTPSEIAALKVQLRQEQLKNELLNNMIDIASKELGIDIRKKPGTRRSK